ncbi:MAG TPA: hypothetical protein VD997_16935 [Phycisphaerales bacterium]|nr:hypothetical protein [Phycisphaerales bacterium]
MDWRFWKHRGSMDEGARARLEHSIWLTDAIESGREYPRIPTRPVVTGGFSRLLVRRNGPDLARRWWDAALSRVND